MKQNLSLWAAAAMIAAAMFVSCAKDAAEPVTDAAASPETRAGNNGKTVMVYVETNDINPLNGLTYERAGGVKFIDVLNLFAANINKDGNDPSIHFNQELAPIMAQKDVYIEPLQNAGIKVCLTLLPNWQNIGPANLTGQYNDPTSQVAKFARLVAWVVYTYELDGVNIDDEYAGYTSLVPGSYGNLTKALRAEFDNRGGNKLITVFQWGNYGQIDAAAGAMIDYADSGDFTKYDPSIQIAGVTAARYMPETRNLGSSSSSIVAQARAGATNVRTGGYGGVMGFNMRANGSAQPIFNAWAQGLDGVNFGQRVTWNGVNYTQNQTFIPGGHTLTNANVPANF